MLLSKLCRQRSTSRPHAEVDDFATSVHDRESNRRYHTYPQVDFRRIAWVALAKRLVAQDEMLFSRGMRMLPVRCALAKRYSGQMACLDRLQLREEEPGSLQIRRLKSFCEPGIHVAELPPGVVGSLLRDPQPRQAHRRTEFQRPGLL